MAELGNKPSPKESGVKPNGSDVMNKSNVFEIKGNGSESKLLHKKEAIVVPSVSENCLLEKIKGLGSITVTKV